MNYEPNLGLYDMRRDATGLPRSLANKINSNIYMSSKYSPIAAPDIIKISANLMI